VTGEDTKTAVVTGDASHPPQFWIGWWKFQRIDVGESVYASKPGSLAEPYLQGPLPFREQHKQELFIGREEGEGTDIVLPSPEKEVSRRHARLFVSGREIRIEDRRSKNGTVVSTDGASFPALQRLTAGSSAPLRAGTLVRLAGDWLGEVIAAPDGSAGVEPMSLRFRVAELGLALREWDGWIECKLVQALCASRWFESRAQRDRILGAAADHCRRRSLPVLRVEHVVPPVDQDLPSFISDDRQVWHIRYGGKVLGPLRLRGVWFVATAVGNPGRDFDVLELVNAYDGDEADLSHGSAGEVLDGRAVREFRSRLAELEEDLDQARKHNDFGRIQKCAAEQEQLRGLLRGAIGLGWRRRKLNDNRERARSRVRHAVDRALDAIEGIDRDLGRKMRVSIDTGAKLSFDSRRFYES
jgi:FHA domain